MQNQVGQLTLKHHSAVVVEVAPLLPFIGDRLGNAVNELAK